MSDERKALIKQMKLALEAARNAAFQYRPGGGRTPLYDQLVSALAALVRLDNITELQQMPLENNSER